jgi:predicted nuclease with TOPRIM domain
MTDKRIKGVLDRLEKLKRDKQNWLETYQRVGEYVRTLKQDFNGVRPQGEILTTQVFDDTAPNAAHLTASSLK